MLILPKFAKQTSFFRSKWLSSKLGVSAFANGDTKRQLTDVGASADFRLGTGRMSTSATYEVHSNCICGRTRYSMDGSPLTLEAALNSVDKDLVLKVLHGIDKNNFISPTLSLKSRRMSYEWLRKWNGGSVSSTYHPGDSLSVEWKDAGATGSWTTRAHIPLDNMADTKVSFGHEWDV